MASTQWWRAIEADEIAALATAAADVVARIDNELSALRTCPLDDLIAEPTIARLADEIRRELVDGKGFVVLRGLPVDGWLRRDAFIAYWLLGNVLGHPIPNNSHGDMIGHVADLGRDVDAATTRGYDTNAQLAYHCDQCDIVGLMCLQKSKSGGLSKLVSSKALHDAIGANRPDLLEVLCGAVLLLAARRRGCRATPMVFRQRVREGRRGVAPARPGFFISARVTSSPRRRR